jgi:excisionase family DNA binding protein
MLRQNMAMGKVMPQEQEVPAIKQLEHILGLEGFQAKLVGVNAEEILIPESVYQALRQVVHAFVLGQAISIVPQEREMTTQEAADFLNVSRPHLIKLLEQGEIPYILVGSHRRINSLALMKYKEKRDAKRSNLLDELIQESQDMGFYD